MRAPSEHAADKEFPGHGRLRGSGCHSIASGLVDVMDQSKSRSITLKHFSQAWLFH